MRVLVCGGRDFTDRAFVFNMLCQYDEQYGPFTRVIHGGATGADSEAKLWAARHALPEIEFKVSKEMWRKLGKAAGPIRNARMLAQGKPDLVIAFPGGKGTADMVRQAEAAGVRTIDVARKAWP